MLLFPSQWKEGDHKHIIASYCAIGGAPFVQQSIWKSLWGSTPVFFTSILVVWNFLECLENYKIQLSYYFFFLMKVRNYLLLPICLYVVCLIRNCKLKKLFFTLVLPNCNFWILVCVNMCVFQISLKVLHHRHLQWFVLQQTVSYKV